MKNHKTTTTEADDDFRPTPSNTIGWLIIHIMVAVLGYVMGRFVANLLATVLATGTTILTIPASIAFVAIAVPLIRKLGIRVV